MRSEILADLYVFPVYWLLKLLNHHVVTELMLIDVLMNNMMERISDPCCTVRMLAVRGLGNIAVGSPEKVEYSLPLADTEEDKSRNLIFFFICSLPSFTRWINMQRSCWQPWARAWRRRMTQVTWRQNTAHKQENEKLQLSNLALLIYCINLSPRRLAGLIFSLTINFVFIKSPVPNRALVSFH